MYLHLPTLTFIYHYLGWSFSLLRSSWGHHHLPLYSLQISLYLYFISFRPPCSSHIAFLCSGFPLLLTSLPLPFFHLSKDSQYPSDFFTWTHHPSHLLSAAYNTEKPYSFFFYFLLCHVVEIMSKRTVPNLQCLKGDCLCCREERERGLDAPARQMK